MSENRKTRQSNIELLRIICIFTVVLHHFSIHSGFAFATDKITFSREWIHFIQMSGFIGIDALVLISGYFLVKAGEQGRVERILKLWGQLLFYNVVLYLVFVIAGQEEFGVVAFVKCFLPVSYSRWWYASAYFVLFLIAPFINVMLNKMSKTAYKRMLLMTTVCWVLFPTFLLSAMEGNSLVWFVYLYAVAGYIRLYEDDFKSMPSAAKLIWITAGLIIFTFLTAVAFDILGIKITTFANHATHFYNRDEVPVVIGAICVFMGFKKLNIPYSKFINTVASATMGVYLIHEHDSVRNFIWRFADGTKYVDSPMLVPYSIIVPVIVFAGCVAIELIRMATIEKVYVRFVKKIAPVIESKINRIVGE